MYIDLQTFLFNQEFDVKLIDLRKSISKQYLFWNMIYFFNEY